MIIPERLKKGDEIRVVAPSRSLSAVKPGVAERAAQRLAELGFHVTYARGAAESGRMSSADIASRIGDLHEAFADPNVKAVLSAIGGFNVNGILDILDYGLLQSHPKILCGYSDITALLCAVEARTGLVTYHGPHFSTFGFEEGRAYTESWFRSCVMTGEPGALQPYDEAWTVISEGEGEGKIIGGNLCTLNLLQGTCHMPDLRGALLFLEDDNIVGEYFPYEFERNLRSLTQTEGFSDVRGLVLGRFEAGSCMDKELIRHIVSGNARLAGLPVIAGANFGHVRPFFTFPVGGRARITAKNEHAEIVLTAH